MSHSKWVVAATGLFDMAFAKAKRAELKLKELAQIKAATMIGCPW
jgi:hypothetical protein